MKNIIGMIFVCAVIFTSCERKFDLGEFNYEEIEAPVIAPLNPDAEATGKRGMGGYTNGDWQALYLKLKPHWYYNWGSTWVDDKPSNLEFVPMKWGKWGDIDVFVANMKVLKEAGKIHYLLGFNEPDGVEQANMTVDQAIALWPKLEEVGLPLGSPACVNPTGTWITEFMQKASEKGLRVDFMTVHWYGGASASSFISRLYDTYNQFGKPIWVTEFAPADWTAATPADNKFTPAQVLNFMKEALPQLEALDFVHRYTWFAFSQTSAVGTSSALFDADRNLTPLGEYYASFKPNFNIGVTN
ncbi:MAG TPA: glycoside hydrolase family protein [Yeosuana sp.]